MEILFTCCILCIWIRGHGTGANPSESVPQLITKELTLLTEEDDPKCFTRTLQDFTCFWEADAGRFYEFYYQTEDDKRGCKLTQQRSNSQTVVHICSFPISDVYLYEDTYITVVDNSTNTTTYSRTLYVDEKVLLNPVENVSVDITEEPRELYIKWKAAEHKLKYEIRYSSPSKPEEIQQTESVSVILKHLVPGEVYTVQIRVKPHTSSIWSDWSKPVEAMVPQQAGDISLMCYTSDLCNVQCQWNEEQAMNQSHYRVYYKLEDINGKSDWKICAKDKESTQRCMFPGDQYSAFRVKITTGTKLPRTFFTSSFTMKSSIKTEPPNRLRGESSGGKLCLQWDAPSQVLSHHLVYDIRYHLLGRHEWKIFTLNSSKTTTYIDVHEGNEYIIQVRAKPNQALYTGYCSDWSKTLAVDLPSNRGLFLFICIPLVLLIISILIKMSRCLSTIKRYLWPPVPNLDKLVESFLTNMNGSHWPAFTIKPCSDDISASVVEVVHEESPSPDAERPLESLSYLTPQQTWPLIGSDGIEHFPELEANCDYVTLNSAEVLPCLQGNEYVYGNLSGLGLEKTQGKCTCTWSSRISGSSTDILNHSYLLMSENALGRAATLMEAASQAWTH
ncbi:thrombopoietin receptor isoform X2 [Denticeps clupeoides]|uniref:thrombopoietin receptor isoform X2 n=1 Tax=Denticeps clupeoides TaxID=299321 RepID=UPI0010A38F66|nr:thrombopoietin receptor isoform X2 [Denticeps clupeoides]